MIRLLVHFCGAPFKLFRDYINLVRLHFFPTCCFFTCPATAHTPAVGSGKLTHIYARTFRFFHFHSKCLRKNWGNIETALCMSTKFSETRWLYLSPHGCISRCFCSQPTANMRSVINWEQRKIWLQMGKSHFSKLARLQTVSFLLFASWQEFCLSNLYSRKFRSKVQ